jgi:hypothetical protein
MSYSYGGAGGSGFSTSTAGQNGNAPGGAGAGGCRKTGATGTRSGGNGAGGIVCVTWFNDQFDRHMNQVNPHRVPVLRALTWMVRHRPWADQDTGIWFPRGLLVPKPMSIRQIWSLDPERDLAMVRL